MACAIIRHLINLFEYFLLNLPPLANEPIPNIKIIKTMRQVIIEIMRSKEGIYLLDIMFRFEISDFKDPV